MRIRSLLAMVALSAVGCSGQVAPGGDDTVRAASTSGIVCITGCEGDWKTDPWGSAAHFTSGYIITGTTGPVLGATGDTVFLGVDASYNAAVPSSTALGSWVGIAPNSEYPAYQRWPGSLNKSECWAPSLYAEYVRDITAPAPGGTPPGGGSDPNTCPQKIQVCINTADLQVLRTTKECQVVERDPPEKCNGLCQ